MFLDQIFEHEELIASDIDDTPIIAAILANDRPENVYRECQCIPKVDGLVERTVPNYSNREFRRDFRINKVTFDRLKEQLSGPLQYEDRDSGKKV